jgi:DNA mismatch repair protein MutL
MPVIHELSPTIVAKIAAGEVVERPVFALKELLDNAIDAHATAIKIDIEDGGLKKIHVIDNGVGISKEDIKECYKPHTTSKISSEEDLIGIKSLGFRGEALWSIAAISQMTIKSKRRHDSEGTLVELSYGELERMTPIGMPDGTEILVQNLFDNVPARKKFLKSPNKEFQEILDLVIKYALSFPQCAFFLRHNGRKYIDLTKDQDTAQRAGILFGAQLYENLLPFTHEHEYIRLAGFITKPQAAITSQDKQFIFVNNRIVWDKLVAASIKSAYGTLLEPRVYPIFMLFIDIPHERVDVNVHPRKEQVAFAEIKKLTEAIQKAVADTLAEQNIMYHDLRWKKGEYINNTPVALHLREGGTRTYAGVVLKQTATPWNVYTQNKIHTSSEVIQLHNLYLLVSTEKGFILLDQHAAHERILYEQFLKEFAKEKAKGEVVVLKEPIRLNLPLLDTHILEENSSVLQDIGFEVKITDTVQIRQMPKLFKDRNIQKLIEEILLDIKNNEEVKEVDTKTNKMIAYIACRTAIKAGDKLTKEQAKKLVKQLETVENRYTCPHGRPIQIEITLNELHTLFHRR